MLISLIVYKDDFMHLYYLKKQETMALEKTSNNKIQFGMWEEKRGESNYKWHLVIAKGSLALGG